MSDSTNSYRLSKEKEDHLSLFLDEMEKERKRKDLLFRGEDLPVEEQEGAYQSRNIENLLEKVLGPVLEGKNSSSHSLERAEREHRYSRASAEETDPTASEPRQKLLEHNLVFEYLHSFAQKNRLLTEAVGDDVDDLDEEKSDYDDMFYTTNLVVKYKGEWLIGTDVSGVMGGGDSFIGRLSPEVYEDTESFHRDYKPFTIQDVKDYWEKGKLKEPEDLMSIVKQKEGEENSTKVDEFLKQILTDEEYEEYGKIPMVRHAYSPAFIESVSVHPVGDVRFLLLKQEIPNYPIGWENALNEVAAKGQGLVNPVYVSLEDGLLSID